MTQTLTVWPMCPANEPMFILHDPVVGLFARIQRLRSATLLQDGRARTSTPQTPLLFVAFPLKLKVWFTPRVAGVAPSTGFNPSCGVGVTGLGVGAGFATTFTGISFVLTLCPAASVTVAR